MPAKIAPKGMSFSGEAGPTPAARSNDLGGLEISAALSHNAL